MPDHPIGAFGQQELRLVGGEGDGEAAAARGPHGPAIEAGRGKIEEQRQDEARPARRVARDQRELQPGDGAGDQRDDLHLPGQAVRTAEEAEIADGEPAIDQTADGEQDILQGTHRKGLPPDRRPVGL